MSTCQACTLVFTVEADESHDRRPSLCPNGHSSCCMDCANKIRLVRGARPCPECRVPLADPIPVNHAMINQIEQGDQGISAAEAFRTAVREGAQTDLNFSENGPAGSFSAHVQPNANQAHVEAHFASVRQAAQERTVSLATAANISRNGPAGFGAVMLGTPVQARAGENKEEEVEEEGEYQGVGV